METEIATQVAAQLQIQATGMRNMMWFMVVVNGIFLALISLFGYWIWDLNKKVGRAVQGSDCEERNKLQYATTEKLRLEIKEDAKMLADKFSQDLEKSSVQRDKAIASLQAQLTLYTEKVGLQQQANFDVIVDVLREIGCSKGNR